MAPKLKSADVFVNRYASTLTMSAANTLTYGSIEFGISMFDNVALIIHELELAFSSTVYREMAAATDEMYVAFCNSNQMTALASADPRIYWMWRLVGMGVNVEPCSMPFRVTWSHLPGGGLLVPPRPLYMAMGSAGFAAAGVVSYKILFTVKELDQGDYLELVQSVLNTAL